MKEDNVQLRWGKKFLLIPVVLLVIFFTNCKDDETKVVFDPNLPVLMESFSPDTGGVGTQLIITGENFGSDPKQVKVVVGRNNYEAKVIGVDGRHIYAVVSSQSDTGKVVVTVGAGEKAKTATSQKNFCYIFRENVSTYCGTGEAKTFDGPRDPQSSEPACLNDPIWLDIDRDGVMYVLERDKGMRIVKEDLVSSAFRKKENGRQGRFRTIALSVTQDSIFTAHDDGDASKAAFFISTREKGFLDIMEVVTGTSQNNMVVVNPVSGDVFFNRFGDCQIFRYDFSTGKTIKMGSLGDNTHELHFCWSLDGTKLFIVARNRNYIAVGDYDLATKTLSNIRAVMGKMNDDGNGAKEGHQDGQGFNVMFWDPSQMVAGPKGEYYVADRRNNCIRRITSDYRVTTYAGMPGYSGSVDGLPLKSMFNEPEGLAIDKEGALYVADRGNHKIRKIVIE